MKPTIGRERFYSLYTENKLVTDIRMIQYKEFNEGT